MTYDKLKTIENKVYLGFCEEKGYVYSAEIRHNEYKIVAVRNNEVTVLIEYTLK